jgi:ribonuclease P protein component
VGRRARGVLSVGRSQRLRAGEFEAIFRQRGRREELESFIALWRPCPGEGKVGFAVGRRLGGAVERNRARRRLREAYRQERAAKREGFDVVFVGRSALLNRPFADLRGDIQRVLRTLARRAESGAKSASGGTEA